MLYCDILSAKMIVIKIFSFAILHMYVVFNNKENMVVYTRSSIHGANVGQRCEFLGVWYNRYPTQVNHVIN